MFQHTKIFSVLVRPEDGLYSKPVFLKEGFNLYAFLFSGVWALYKRLWMPLLLIIIFNGSLALLVKKHYLLKFSSVVIQLGFNVLVGFQANEWVRSRLLGCGYIVADVSVADSLLGAEQRYFERALSRSAS